MKNDKVLLAQRTGIFLTLIVGTFVTAMSTTVTAFLLKRMPNVTFALQTVAMSMLNSPATTMALSQLTGNMRIDGSAVFNTIQFIQCIFIMEL